jgi:hypothetical protein
MHQKVKIEYPQDVRLTFSYILEKYCQREQTLSIFEPTGEKQALSEKLYISPLKNGYVMNGN